MPSYTEKLPVAGFLYSCLFSFQKFSDILDDIVLDAVAEHGIPTIPR